MSAPRFVVLGGVGVPTRSHRGPGGGNGVSALPFGKIGSLASTPNRRLGQRASFLARTAIVSCALTLCLSSVALAQSTSCAINPSTPYQQSALQPVLPTAPLLPQLPSTPSAPNSLGTSLLPTTPPAQPYVSTPMVPNTPSTQQPSGTGGPMVPNTPNTPITPSGTPGLPAALNTSANTIQETLNENFANGIDKNVWGYNYPWSDTCNTSHPGMGNYDPTQAVAYMNPNCPSQSGGNVFSPGPNGLDIAIKPTPAGVDAVGKPYVSGQIRTLQPQKYGYFEMTAKLPTGGGLGGAFWLLPSSGAWPPELDVMESQGENPNSVTQTMHDGTSSNVSNDQIVANVSGTQTGFHTYGMDWEADRTTFYVDGKATGSYATPASMQQPMYAIVSTNASPPGSQNWHATVAPGTPATSMQVKNVSAYCLLASGCN